MPVLSRLFSPLLILLLPAFISPLAHAEKMHSLRLVVDSPTRHAPPFAWFDENKQREDGYVRNILLKVFTELGYQLDFVPFALRTQAGQNTLVQALRQKQVDGIAYISPSEDNNETLLLSKEPIMLAKLSVIRLKGDTRGSAMKDLLDQKGMSFFPKVDQAFFNEQAKRLGHKSAKVELDNSLSWAQAINKLESKEADYVLELSEVFNALSKTHLPKNALLASSQEPVIVLPIYLGLTKSLEHEALLKRFDDKLADLKASGEKDFLFRSYMNKYIRYYINQGNQG